MNRNSSLSRNLLILTSTPVMFKVAKHQNVEVLALSLLVNITTLLNKY